MKSAAGLLERENRSIDAKYYSAIILFEDETVALLTQNDITQMDEKPDDAGEPPIQFADGKEDVIGCLITNAFVLHNPAEKLSGINGPQLFLVLDSERMMGIVPAQRGTYLLVETRMSSPLFRHYTTLTTLDNKAITMEELMGF